MKDSGQIDSGWVAALALVGIFLLILIPAWRIH